MVPEKAIAVVMELAPSPFPIGEGGLDFVHMIYVHSDNLNGLNSFAVL